MAACSEGDVAEFLTVKSSFESPFPKRSKNLTWKLGDEFTLKHKNDTLDFKVKFDSENRHNFIIQKQTNDTVFAGTVSKFRGLYYFNRQLNDTTYWIYAVKIENGTIQGLQTEWIQMKAWDSEFDNLLTKSDKPIKSNSLVLKYVDRQRKIIRLTPDKDAMRYFYESIIDSLPADTLIDWYEPVSNSEIEKEITTKDLKESDTNQLEIIGRLYPNPASDNVTLTLKNNKTTFQYGIFDPNGKQVNVGLLTKTTNNIDISELTSGSYFIRVYSSYGEVSETIKLIKK